MVKENNKKKAAIKDGGGESGDGPLKRSFLIQLSFKSISITSRLSSSHTR